MQNMFPHYTYEIDDKSREILPPPQPVGLHNPVFFLFAEKGPVNIPIRGSAAFLKRIFGSKVFNLHSKFTQHPTIFAREAAKWQDIWVVRLADKTVSEASLVFEAEVKSEDIIQYTKNVRGNRIVDSNGDYVPAFEADGTTPITKAGIKLTWKTRKLKAGESIDNLLPSTIGSITTYPIVAFKSEGAGSAGSLNGIKLFHTPGKYESVSSSAKSRIYDFTPVRLNSDTDISLPVNSIYNSPSISVSLANDAFDAGVNINYTIDMRTQEQYASSYGNIDRNLLESLSYSYGENVETIGKLVLAVSADISDSNPQMINIVSGVSEDNKLYDNLEVTNAPLFMNENKINYFSGGSDGDISLDSLENLTRAYLSGDVYPEIGDSARYPFTHLYDSGYKLETKIDLTNFLSVRDDVIWNFSTQDLSRAVNTKDEDQSSGMAIRSAVLLHPESKVMGTAAIRASIYQQVGWIANDRTYTKPVPLTLARLIKRCQNESTVKVKGDPRGLPNSKVDMFHKFSWTPVSDTAKQMSAINALNYVQYYDVNDVYFPDYVSVYPFRESVLSNESVVDYLTYLNHLGRFVWATYSGRDDDIETLYDIISRDIDTRAFDALGLSLTTTTTIYQTESDKKNGDRFTIRIAASGNMAIRIMNMIIPVTRN